MTDVRSLLRSELASRGQSATKTPTKPSSKKRKLDSSSVAVDSSISKKSRSTSSSQSLSQPSQSQPRPTSQPTAGAGSKTDLKKKRQSLHVAPDLDTVPEEEGPIDVPEDEREAKVRDEAPVPLDAPTTTTSTTALESNNAAPVSAPDPGVDEDEWAAFEQDIAAEDAAEPTSKVPRSALNAPASIEAAPMTAGQIAAQAREEASSQRGKREVEAEEEKEEADARLLEEFEEMGALEERVRRLRERREALRGASGTAEKPDDALVGVGDGAAPMQSEAVVDEEDESSDDGEGDEWDMWRR